MPVVTVLAPVHEQVPTLLRGVADAVAETLELDAGGVLAIHAVAGATAAGHGADTAPWIVVTLQGSDRGHEKMDAARRAADTAVTTWAQGAEFDLGGVWTQWQTPQATS